MGERLAQLDAKWETRWAELDAKWEGRDAKTDKDELTPGASPGNTGTTTLPASTI